MVLLTLFFVLFFARGSFSQGTDDATASQKLNTEASSLKVPYMTPMILGRTYDYSTNEVGDDIFDQAARENIQTINHHRTNIQYTMVNDIKDVQDVLDVNGELSLKVKAGLVDISGSGSYLKEEKDRTDFVEVLVKVEFETLTETLHSSTQPIENWRTLPTIGKHYVRSITYGGMLIASMRFYAKSGKSLQDIKAEIDGKVNAASLSVGIQGQFRKLTSSVTDTTDLVIKYYSTVVLENVPQDQTGLEDAIANFPELVKQQVNEAGEVRGVPLHSNVVSLSTLDPGNEKLTFIYDSLLASHLGELEEMYDDLLSTDRLVKGWLKNQYKLQDADQLKISAFYTNLSNTIQVFERTIAGLTVECDRTAADDTEDSCGFNKLTEAITAYSGTGNPSPRKYYREFCKVQEEVELADDNLEDVATEIEEGKGSIQSKMGRLNREFKRLLDFSGSDDELEAEFLVQEGQVQNLVDRTANILPGCWFSAVFNGDSAVEGDFDTVIIPFTKQAGSENIEFSNGCMKAPFKGIYLINFHILKPFVTEDDSYFQSTLTVTLVLKPGVDADDYKVITRSSVEDDEDSSNCNNCDHALTQTVVLKVSVNYFVCLAVGDGKVFPSEHNTFSSVLLRKL